MPPGMGHPQPPWATCSVYHHPLSGKLPPHVQPKPPLSQFETILSGPNSILLFSSAKVFVCAYPYARVVWNAECTWPRFGENLIYHLIAYHIWTKKLFAVNYKKMLFCSETRGSFSLFPFLARLVLFSVQRCHQDLLMLQITSYQP